MKLPPFPLLLETWHICGNVILHRNPIFYSFSRLIAIVANTNAHVYAREEQIVTIRMIVLEEKFRACIKTWKWRFWTAPSTRGGMKTNFWEDFIVIT